MAVMNISITTELAQLINEKVASGRFNSANDVIEEGMRLMKEQDEIRRMRLEELRKEIALGTEQLERGEVNAYASGKEVAAKIKAEGRTRIAEHQTVKA